MRNRVVLAYSGGLDTSVSIRWIQEKYDMDVITLTIDLGQGRELEEIKHKAVTIGAIKAIVYDAKEMFVNHYVFPALQGGAIYEGEYPLATALGRPLIAGLLVDIARDEGAAAVAHGCTGKGNDQVRIDVAVKILAPRLQVIAPVREWRMTRDEEIKYAMANDIPIPVTQAKPYSVDQNLWGRSIEAGVLEDPAVEPPEDVYEWTVAPDRAPAAPQYVDIRFESGIPVALDGAEMEGVELIERLNQIAGQHGVGRIDHVENRLVGIKSREIYEAPAATVLHKAHQALEDLTLSKQQARFKTTVSREYADLIYNGLWFTSLHQDLRAFIASNQMHVTGTIRMKLWKGNCFVVGRTSPKSLYSFALATYDSGDQFDHNASVGFITVHGLAAQTQAQAQLIGPAAAAKELPVVVPPRVDRDALEVESADEGDDA
ncbi:MAG: argininosuccinate synthase [Candidatus Latescibacteria bacterium]|nr:argininosuccinate synthase [Candidatus Latescibacterota bacterium]